MHFDTLSSKHPSGSYQFSNHVINPPKPGKEKELVKKLANTSCVPPIGLLTMLSLLRTSKTLLLLAENKVSNSLLISAGACGKEDSLRGLNDLSVSPDFLEPERENCKEIQFSIRKPFSCGDLQPSAEFLCFSFTKISPEKKIRLCGKQELLLYNTAQQYG